MAKSTSGTASVSLTSEECAALLAALDVLMDRVSHPYRDMTIAWYSRGTQAAGVARDLRARLEKASKDAGFDR
jgi:hypothetical protein